MNLFKKHTEYCDKRIDNDFYIAKINDHRYLHGQFTDTRTCETYPVTKHVWILNSITREKGMFFHKQRCGQNVLYFINLKNTSTIVNKDSDYFYVNRHNWKKMKTPYGKKFIPYGRYWSNNKKGFYFWKTEYGQTVNTI